jgi:hypothetical protein
MVQRKAGGHFCITSNVDGLMTKAGFPADSILEVHGSLARLQCLKSAKHGTWQRGRGCGDASFSGGSGGGGDGGGRGSGIANGRGLVETTTVDLDSLTVSEASAVPVCKAFRCCAVARPNVLFFKDTGFCDRPLLKPRERLARWLEGMFAAAALRGEPPNGNSSAAGAGRGYKVAIVEVGAGTAVQTIRNTTEQIGLDALSRGCQPTVVRINTAPPAAAGSPVRLIHIQQPATAALVALAAKVSAVATAVGAIPKAKAPPV